MIDYMAKKRARLAAAEYMRGARMRSDAAQLSDRVLASKFGCHYSSIKKAREGLPVQTLSQEEQQLIRACGFEKARIDEQLPRFTKQYLANHHGVSFEAIDVELQLAGWGAPEKSGAVA